MVYQGLIECFRDTWIGLHQSKEVRKVYKIIMRRPNAAGRHDHIIVIAHSPYSFNDFIFIIRNNLDPFQFNAYFEAVLGY